MTMTASDYQKNGRDAFKADVALLNASYTIKLHVSPCKFSNSRHSLFTKNALLAAAVSTT